MKLTMRLRGFIRMAGAEQTLKFSMITVLLLSASAGAIYGLWTNIYPRLDTTLNAGCTDTSAETGEAPYAPSKLVAQCTQSAHIATLALICIITVLLVCAVTTALTSVIDGYAARAYRRGSRTVPVKLCNLMAAVRRNCGYIAFAMAFCIITVLVPRG